MLVDFFFPRRCLICNSVLASGEKDLCLRCVNIAKFERDAWGKYALLLASHRIEHLDIFLSYPYCKRALWDFKYKSNFQKGKWLGGLWATHLEGCEWIKEIDFILPIPLHWRKVCLRGYNQSEVLGDVLSKRLDIAMRTKVLKRVRNNIPQVRAKNRWLNVRDVFRLRDSKALSGKHILLIDDVITSSATVNEALGVLSGVDDVKISLAFLSSNG